MSIGARKYFLSHFMIPALLQVICWLQERLGVILMFVDIVMGSSLEPEELFSCLGLINL
jgi:hypothetical protein